MDLLMNLEPRVGQLKFIHFNHIKLHGQQMKIARWGLFTDGYDAKLSCTLDDPSPAQVATHPEITQSRLPSVRSGDLKKKLARNQAIPSPSEPYPSTHATGTIVSLCKNPIFDIATHLLNREIIGQDFGQATHAQSVRGHLPHEYDVFQARVRQLEQELNNLNITQAHFDYELSKAKKHYYGLSRSVWSRHTMDRELTNWSNQIEKNWRDNSDELMFQRGTPHLSVNGRMANLRGYKHRFQGANLSHASNELVIIGTHFKPLLRFWQAKRRITKRRFEIDISSSSYKARLSDYLAFRTSHREFVNKGVSPFINVQRSKRMKDVWKRMKLTPSKVRKSWNASPPLIAVGISQGNSWAKNWAPMANSVSLKGLLLGFQANYIILEYCTSSSRPWSHCD